MSALNVLDAIDAETACAWGLVNRVVAPEELLPTARKLAADMATIPPQMLANYKRLIDDGYGLPFRGSVLALLAISTSTSMSRAMRSRRAAPAFRRADARSKLT